MKQGGLGSVIGSFWTLVFLVFAMIVGAEPVFAQTEPGVWKCYHSIYMNICGADGEGTAIEDYYAVKWPFCKVPEAPGCYNPNNSTEWCDGDCIWHAGVPPRDIPMPARGAASLYCPTGTVARQGVCVAVSGQGQNCPITSSSTVDPLSGRSTQQETDWTPRSAMASLGDPVKRSAALSANVFPVGLMRYYSSKYESLNFPFSSRLGVGWRTTFDASASVNANPLTSATLIHLLLPGSNEYSFAKQSGIWKPVLPRLMSSGAVKWDIAGSDVGFVLSIANNQIVLRHPAGSEYVFDRNGRLIQLRNGAGYIQTLEYSGDLNTRVFDNLGGWVKFNYGNPAPENLVTTAETSDGTLIFIIMRTDTWTSMVQRQKRRMTAIGPLNQ